MRVTERESRVVQQSNRFLLKAKEQKKELQKKTAQKKEEVVQWEARLKKLQPKRNRQPDKKTTQGEAGEAKKRALAEAMAAFKAAEAALAGAEKAEKDMAGSIRKAERNLSRANRKLDRYGEMAKEVQAEPGQATKIAKKIAK